VIFFVNNPLFHFTFFFWYNARLVSSKKGDM
jgi:hypothetical protein